MVRSSAPTVAVARSLLAACALAASLTAQGAEHRIGTKGANVELDKPWQRQKLDPDLGEDQFQAVESRGLFARGSEVYVVAMEIEALLENEADYRAALNDHCSVGNDAPITVAKEAGWTRATRSFDTKLNGIDCAMRCELLVGDGLAYHLMTWSMKSQRAKLDARVAAFLQGFEFPAADSEHGKRRQPQAHSAVFGDVEVTYSLRPATMKKVPHDDDELAQFHSGDQKQMLSVFSVNGYRTLQAMVDGERDALAKWDTTYKETARGELEIGGTKCAWLLGARNGQTIKSLFVPVGGLRNVTWRWLSAGEVDAERPEREALFQSVRRQQIGDLLTLPTAPEAAERRRDSRMDRFLRTGKEQGTALAMWNAVGAQRDGDAWILWDWQDVHEIGRSGHRQLLDGGEAIRWALRWRGQCHVGGHDGAVRVVHDGTVGAVVFRAENACVVGADLVIVRRPRSALPGLGVAPAEAALVRRTAAGDETTLGTLAIGAVAEMVADQAGTAVLLRAGRPAEPLGALQQTLVLLPLATLQPVAMGDWDAVAAIAATATGWLVHGRPTGEAEGIWWYRSPTDREVLLTGDVGSLRTLDLATDTLTVLAPTGMGQLQLLELPLAACREEGRVCQPFAPQHLEGIGSRLVAALGNGAPRTAAEVAAARARADAFAKEVAGQGLPTSADDVESLLSSIQDWEAPLQQHGRILLGLLVATSALAGGGEWVEGEASDWSQWHLRTMPVHEAPFAIVVQPGNQVSTSLDDSEGYASLVMDVHERRGRPLLVGTSPTALRARLAQLAPKGLDAAVRTGDVAALRAQFAEREAQPELRRHVYGLLAAAGKHEAIEALARDFAAREKPEAIDLVAAIAAWSQRAAEPEAAKALFAAALAAVQKAPGEAALFLWLGRAAERAFPDQPGKARQCYERAQELAPYGDIGTAAKEALGRPR